MPLTNTNSIILLQAAKFLGISAKILDLPKGKIQLTKGKKSHIVHKYSLGLNLHPAIVLTHNKAKTLSLLQRHGLPVPGRQTHFPVVIKPVFGQKGRQVYADIKTPTQLASARRHIAGPTLLQPFIKGQDLRFFVLAGRVIGITHRRPPTISGDGHSTIRQLIEAENLRRLKLTQTTGRRRLNRLRHWPRISWYQDLDAVLPKGKTIAVYPLANFSTGGSAHALTPKQIHPSLIRLAQEAVRLTGLTVAGVDMIVSSKGRSSSGRKAYILEINSDPSLRLHDWPNTGRSQGVATKLLRYIFAN